MNFLMNEPFSHRRTASRWGDLGLEMRKRLVKAIERLSDAFSAINLERMARRELKDREAQQCDLGYEARKRELLVALRQRISEKHTKND